MLHTVDQPAQRAVASVCLVVDRAAQWVQRHGKPHDRVARLLQVDARRVEQRQPSVTVGEERRGIGRSNATGEHVAVRGVGASTTATPAGGCRAELT